MTTKFSSNNKKVTTKIEAKHNNCNSPLINFLKGINAVLEYNNANSCRHLEHLHQDTGINQNMPKEIGSYTSNASNANKMNKKIVLNMIPDTETRRNSTNNKLDKPNDWMTIINEDTSGTTSSKKHPSIPTADVSLNNLADKRKKKKSNSSGKARVLENVRNESKFNNMPLLDDPEGDPDFDSHPNPGDYGQQTPVVIQAVINNKEQILQDQELSDEITSALILSDSEEVNEQNELLSNMTCKDISNTTARHCSTRDSNLLNNSMYLDGLSCETLGMKGAAIANTTNEHLLFESSISTYNLSSVQVPCVNDIESSSSALTLSKNNHNLIIAPDANHYEVVVPYEYVFNQVAPAHVHTADISTMKNEQAFINYSGNTDVLQQAINAAFSEQSPCDNSMIVVDNCNNSEWTKPFQFSEWITSITPCSVLLRKCNVTAEKQKLRRKANRRRRMESKPSMSPEKIAKSYYVPKRKMTINKELRSNIAKSEKKLKSLNLRNVHFSTDSNSQKSISSKTKRCTKSFGGVTEAPNAFDTNARVVENNTVKPIILKIKRVPIGRKDLSKYNQSEMISDQFSESQDKWVVVNNVNTAVPDSDKTTLQRHQSANSLNCLQDEEIAIPSDIEDNAFKMVNFMDKDDSDINTDINNAQYHPVSSPKKWDFTPLPTMYPLPTIEQPLVSTYTSSNGQRNTTLRRTMVSTNVDNIPYIFKADGGKSFDSSNQIAPLDLSKKSRECSIDDILDLSKHQNSEQHTPMTSDTGFESLSTYRNFSSPAENNHNIATSPKMVDYTSDLDYEPGSPRLIKDADKCPPKTPKENSNNAGQEVTKSFQDISGPHKKSPWKSIKITLRPNNTKIITVDAPIRKRADTPPPVEPEEDADEDVVSLFAASIGFNSPRDDFDEQPTTSNVANIKLISTTGVTDAPAQSLHPKYKKPKLNNYEATTATVHKIVRNNFNTNVERNIEPLITNAPKLNSFNALNNNNSQNNSYIGCNNRDFKTNLERSIEPLITNAPNLNSLNALNNNKTQNNSYIGYNNRDILKIFGRPCFKYLNRMCTLSTCCYVHGLPLPIQIEKTLDSWSKECIQRAYNQFVVRHQRAFILYFNLFCKLFGHRKLQSQLISMVRDCEVFNIYSYFIHIYDGLLKCGLTSIEATKIISETNRNRTLDSIDVLVELIIKSDVVPFAELLDIFSKAKNYKFKVDSLNTLIDKVVESKNNCLIHIMLRIMDNVDRETMCKLNLKITQCLQLLKQT